MCEQFLPNFAGNITYYLDVENPSPVICKIGKWRGALLGIKVNDEAEQLLPWPPYQVKVPEGKCRLEITVYGHRRNALGPFYLNEKWPVRTGPHQHKVYEHPERQLVPFGMLSMPEIFMLKEF